jgi:ligand-binding sensor domain-containing protein
MDDDGALWAGTAYGERGLNYYDGSGWGPPPIPPLPLDFPMPRAFAMSEEVGLFVGLDEGGLAHFDGEEWQVLTSDDGLPGDQVYDLLLIDDEVLLASFDYEVVQFDLQTGAAEVVSQLSGIDVYCMYQADDGSLWFAGDEGAVRYDPETGDWQAFESRPGTIPNRPVTAIVEDDDGLWLGTDGGGTVFYDGSSWETWASDDGLGGNHVEAITQDGAGALWFVHGGSGLTRYDPTSDTWQTFGEDEGVMDWPSYPGVDGEGHLWIGEYGALEWHDGQAWQSYAPVADELAEASVYDLAFGPDDVLWLVTDNGLVRHDPATGEWTTFNADDHPILMDVYAFHVAGDGTVWVGGEEALIRYDGSGWSVPAASGDPPTYVSGIDSAPEGELWVVADGALYHLDRNQWHHYHRPDDGWIERVTVGPDGTVWVGYEGLGRFDPASGDWQVFTMDEGLVHWNVQAIYVTPTSVVWVGTVGGVSRYVLPE